MKMKKESMAVQASKMPIFKMFGFVKMVATSFKPTVENSFVVFPDGSSFVFDKNGNVMFSFCVSAVSTVKAYSQYPIEWVFAKNEAQAIEIFRKKHGISVFCELSAACCF